MTDYVLKADPIVFKSSVSSLGEKRPELKPQKPQESGARSTRFGKSRRTIRREK